MANSNSGTRRSTSARTAASPSTWRRSHGSLPDGSTATNVRATNCWSEAKARMAAFCPAESPSKVKMISPVALTSPMSRRAVRAWSSPKAVPQVATAVVTPARCAAMTSV